MVFFEILTWAIAGMAAAAVRTAMTVERDILREMKLGLAGAIPGGIVGLLVDAPRASPFSVVSLLVAASAAGCVLLFDWLLVDCAPTRGQTR